MPVGPLLTFCAALIHIYIASECRPPSLKSFLMHCLMGSLGHRRLFSAAFQPLCRFFHCMQTTGQFILIFYYCGVSKPQRLLFFFIRARNIYIYFFWIGIDQNAARCETNFLINRITEMTNGSVN